MTFESFKRRHSWRAIVDGQPIGFFSNPDTALMTARYEADECRKHNSSRVPFGFTDAQTGLRYDERGGLITKTAET